MPGNGDRQDRDEALRMLVAMVGALVALVLVLVGGGYFVLGWFGDLGEAFAGGLGLKDSAAIALVVAFLAAIVFALVSGGFGAIGELPFTLLGFFLFFVFFWLMTAWIF